MSKRFEDLDENAQNYLRTFYNRCPQANKASQLARKFEAMADKRRKKQLDRWIDMALESGIPSLKNFAKGLAGLRRGESSSVFKVEQWTSGRTMFWPPKRSDWITVQKL